MPSDMYRMLLAQETNKEIASSGDAGGPAGAALAAAKEECDAMRSQVHEFERVGEWVNFPVLGVSNGSNDKYSRSRLGIAPGDSLGSMLWSMISGCGCLAVRLALCPSSLDSTAHLFLYEDGMKSRVIARKAGYSSSMESDREVSLLGTMGILM